MSSRRHVLPPDQLATHGASPIYDVTPVPASCLEEETHFDPEVVGVSIGGGSGPDDDGGGGDTRGKVRRWNVVTSRHRGSSIANESEVAALASALQAEAPGKKLSPPEIVFVRSFVSATVPIAAAPATSASEEPWGPWAPGKGRGGEDGDDDGSKGESAASQLEIRIDATSALLEWAAAHRHLDGEGSEGGSEGTTAAHSSSGGRGYRGVSVLEVSDAELWRERKHKKKPATGSGGNNGGTGVGGDANGGGGLVGSGGGARSSSSPSSSMIGTRSEFLYDWTYSTPYAADSVYLVTRRRHHGDGGGVIGRDEDGGDGDDDLDRVTNPPAQLATRIRWSPRDASGIEMDLLTDRTKPILLFDDVQLYEDDLHDNGETNLSVKIRVMPDCFYVLLRLYLRVDGVVLRCRDSRIFHRFGSDEVCRDVSWRECAWDDLPGLGLPPDAASWTGEGAQALLGRLPPVDLPDDIPRFSYIDLSSAGVSGVG